MLKRQPGATIAGITLLSASALLILTQLGLPWLNFQRLWPLLLTLVGLSLIAQVVHHATEAPGQIWTGVTLLLTGLYLCIFSLQVGNLTWASLLSYWPFQPLDNQSPDYLDTYKPISKVDSLCQP